MNHSTQRALSKVPEVTLVFWLIKIAATTLGETAGDAVSMSMNLGYLVGTLIFAAIFIVAVIAQIKAKAFHPFLYWATIIATTTVGTTLADFADRSLGIDYAGGSTLLFISFAIKPRPSGRGCKAAIPKGLGCGEAQFNPFMVSLKRREFRTGIC
jgi:uncharacterized membrane-anchored protein